jgi:hypothetical protein
MQHTSYFDYLKHQRKEKNTLKSRTNWFAGPDVHNLRTQMFFVPIYKKIPFLDKRIKNIEKQNKLVRSIVHNLRTQILEPICKIFHSWTSELRMCFLWVWMKAEEMFLQNPKTLYSLPTYIPTY